MTAFQILLGILMTFGAGMAAQWVAWRARLPAIVLLFGLGLLFGPALGLLHPSVTLGDLFHPLVSLLVAIVVFEGGMALDIRQLREAGQGVARLTMLALPVNWILGSLAAHYVGHFAWGTAFLFGAIIVVTGPTVVLPLLRAAKLKPRVASLLRWEAIVNDPLGAILAAVVLQVLLLEGGPHAGRIVLHHTLPDMALAGLEAIAAGILPAYLIRYLFRHDLMPEILKVPVILTLALIVFQLCTIELEGAGLIAVTIFGMTLSNLHIAGMNELRRTKESLVVLIVSVLFILLTADLHRSVLERLSIPVLFLTLSLMFVVRPLGIFLTTIGTNMTWQERVFVGWIAPRGIVAAAVAGAAGLKLSAVGYPSADMIMPAVFALIAATMICNGFTLGPLARLLHLSQSTEHALAIVGANPWSIDLAACLNREGVPVLLVDNRAHALFPALQKGIPVLKAELLSEYGQESLEERPVDYLVAVTRDCFYNGVVCAHLAPHLGRQRVYQVSPGVARLDFYHGLSRDARGKVLGLPSWSWSLFETRFQKGWRFVSKRVTEENQASLSNCDHCMDILMTRRGDMSICSEEDPPSLTPQPGDLLVCMMPKEMVEQTEAAQRVS
ncbi:cation:proton antiporter [Oecophyllibacter saccharovorans]|uniref:Sodium:proton antiporter n=1 Tax=Oecophyllibacter saccharovorans TaxID=2558360 RepID=A0A506UQF0_9PROT|nr:sodium:proton antiporter [Oecophyllibacter saccharovorans]QDH15763.1 sodium:proton antiporter [Oecophyllibacter saccharovorans]TPW35544.1 sodium:proton antiporter [Oecophyllibacter saccharovorans]TPW36783.1 sodium:proton antiporter [Oecophyllibacter saccharovorans]